MATTSTDFGGRYRRYVDTSTANAAVTVTANPGVPFRVLVSTVAYSGNPTQTGVVQALDSGAGSGYDATISTGSSNTRYTSYEPVRLMLAGDDAFTTTAPAGGGILTSSVIIVVELI